MNIRDAHNSHDASIADHILDEAVRWHLASAADNMDWDGFTQWLEADPRHGACYDEIAQTDQWLGAHQIWQGAHANDDGEESSQITAPHQHQKARLSGRFYRYGGGMAFAVAAVIVAMFLPAMWRMAPNAAHDDRFYVTGSKARILTLADGSQIDLAPRSRLDIIGRQETLMRLVGGAFFTIRHDPSRRLEIAAGPLTIQDIGTRFDIQTDAGIVRLAVRDGQVQATTAGLAAPLILTRGRSLTFDAGREEVQMSTLAVADIGDWRRGVLSYQNAPLALVVADLGRYAGISLGISGELADRRFTGTLAIRNADRAPSDLAQIMGLALQRSASGPVLALRR